MPDQRQSWDRQYRCPDPLWKGPAKEAVLPQATRALELGCGNGKTATALVRTVPEVVALDFSIPGLEACQRRVGSNIIDLVRGDLRCLPFAVRAFDLVVAHHVLGLLLRDERDMAVKEARRTLRPGGFLAFRDFSVGDMRAGMGREVENGTYVRGTGIRTHFFTRGEICEMMDGLNEAGLEEVVERKRHDGVEHARAEWVGLFSSP